jgi:hypothetical protein
MFADKAIDFHGERGGERRPGGLYDNAVREGNFTEFEEGWAELPDEVAADAAIEEFADTRNGGGGRELRVDCEVTEFVL